MYSKILLKQYTKRGVRNLLKIIELRKTLEDTSLIDNLYKVNKLTKELIKQTEFITELNKTDFDYINIIMEKTKNNLEKVKELIKI